MMGILGRLFASRSPKSATVATAVNSSMQYKEAVRESDELLARMRDASESFDVPRALMADIWLQRHNIPYLTSVYETAQEVSVPSEPEIKK